MTTASSPAQAVPFRSHRFLHVLCALFLIVWIASAIRPVMMVDWALENLLVFAFVGFLIVSYRRVPLSELSYLLIFVYLCLHEWGAHHKYANVPIGEWMKQVFHTVRNDYDRVVHLSFGLLLAYPQREVLVRKSGLRAAWSLWLTPVIMLGFGAVYEILEAIVANLASPEAGDAFLGLQGDPWDTHKDMFMGFAGAVIAMAFTAAVNHYRERAGRRSDTLVAVGR